MAQPVYIQPGNRTRAWLITAVSNDADIYKVGELFFRVKPSPEVAIEHETFVTVESGIRQGILAEENAELRREVDSQRSTTSQEVRSRLLNDWNTVLQANLDISSELLILINSDMQLARTLLRKDARYRIGKSIYFLDSRGRKNPSANAARLTAAIARLSTQLEFDRISQQSLRNRYLTCTTISEQVAQDIFDLQCLANSRLSPMSVLREVSKRLTRLAIKPYFWGVVWVVNTFKSNDYADPTVVRKIAQALTAEQTVAEIDMLLSNIKLTADKNKQRNLLRLLTLTASRTAHWFDDYYHFGLYIRKFIRQHLSITSSRTRSDYIFNVNTLQAGIRYRSTADDSIWHLSKSGLLAHKK